MEYTRSEYAGDYNIDETFIGEPKEILEVINGIDAEEVLMYDQDDAITFIKAKFEEDGKSEVTRGVIKALLDLEEDYMKSVGIIED